MRILKLLTDVQLYPQFICMVNGPEMTCNAIGHWCLISPAGIIFIVPSPPRENAFTEWFTERLRDELLAIKVIRILLSAKTMAEGNP